MAPALWPIEVVYATHAGDIIQRQLEVVPETAIGEIIKQSGILEAAPEIDLARQAVGLFGELASLEQTAFAGARIEIYRPLKVDPKTARRLRAGSSAGTVRMGRRQRRRLLRGLSC